MARWLVFLAIAIPVLLLACGGGLSRDLDGSDVSTEMSVAVEKEMIFEGAPAATAAPGAFAAPRAPALGARDEFVQASGALLETAQRKVISFASLSLEVEDVQGATVQVRVIAESLGGFVEQLSSSGGPECQRANVTIRVLQDQFFSALDRIEALGIVLSRNLGSEDVSEQFIDLEARLKSALREEQSLLKLLERAGLVSEILAIERELARVRSEIERFQGQLNFLERRVDLATINVSLTPEGQAGEPPSATLVVDVPDVSGTVTRVKGLVVSLDGIVDRVFLSQRDGKEEAELSVRVFSDRFKQAMDFFEKQGKVRSKELVEGILTSDGSDTSSGKPEARIDLFLVSEEDSSNVGLIAAIAAPLGVIALASVLGLLLFWVYRAGRRSG